jgi:ankyrin repeat protein
MALHVAAIYKQEEVAKLLISYGADVNAQDETGKTALFYATENANLKITKLLLTNKANVQDNPEVLNIAVKKECTEIVEVLLQHGADVNSSDERGRTALHFTASGEVRKSIKFRHCELHDSNVRGEIVRMLLSGGANVNVEADSDKTTLHAATEIGYVSVIEALLEYNADINCTTKTGMTPLHIAAEYGRLDCVEVLLKFGANVDSKDEIGRTALHSASVNGLENIVTALLEYGSDINIMNSIDRTLLDYAMAGINNNYPDSVDDDDDDYDPGYGMRTCEIVAENLERHMVKMKTANLYLCEKNLLDFSYFSNFQKECEKEIASMKSELVSDFKVTFYDILTKGVSQLAMYAGNESIAQILRSDDYKIRFPIYASMINSNFRKGEKRKELLEQGSKIFHFLFNGCPQLPHVCIGEIFSYLSDEDLRIIIGACKDIRIQQS